jgi:hypothetical protein
LSGCHKQCDTANSRSRRCHEARVT